MIKIIPILLGILGSYAVAAIVGNGFGVESFAIDFTSVKEAAWIGFPIDWELTVFGGVHDSSKAISAIIAIMPISLATMMEHIGDISAISATCGKNYIANPGLHRSLTGDGLATSLSALFGGPANTTYGENTGVLALSKVYDPRVVRIAAYFAILFSFSPKFAAIINSRAHIISSEGGLIENSFSFYKDADGNMADFRVADRIICNHRQSGCRTMVFYNTDAKEFCYISGLTIEGMKTLGDGENDEFSWNTKADFPDENGLDFVYAVNSFFSDGQSAAILKGPVSGTYYIYCITANRGEPSITKNGRYTVDNSIAPGFGSSPCYAMTTTYGYLLYASCDTLYGYDFRKSPQQCTVLRTFDAPISYMMVDTETDEKYDDCIYVATYDESRSRSGTLYKMQMVDSPDRIETSEPEKLEDGLLKITDMYYKSF